MVTGARRALGDDLATVDRMLEGLERANIMQKADAARAVLFAARHLLGNMAERITALEGATKGREQCLPPDASAPPGA